MDAQKEAARLRKMLTNLAAKRDEAATKLEALKARKCTCTQALDG